jgi:hypothetical protein
LAKTPENLVGQVFGRLTVLGDFEAGSWSCRCECGAVKRVARQSLRQGLTKSCGCIWKEGLGSHHRTHGETGTREYCSWQAMKRRCLDPKNNRYPSHGGRGIKVCERWLASFENFLADMKGRPAGTSLERIDNDGDYGPGNCRWATPIEQSSNTRSAKLETINGITDTHAGWARRAGISAATLCKRLKRGWSFEKALLPDCS